MGTTEPEPGTFLFYDCGMDSLGYDDVFLRLAVAVISGAIIGLDREVRDKPAGLRTMSLVSLGSAVFVLAALGGDGSDNPLPAIQGIITGIGFLGAGAIIRGPSDQAVQGLTTAASIWLASALGIASSRAAWPLVFAGCAFGLLVLIAEPFERWIKARFR